jgi:hypothetical protein
VQCPGFAPGGEGKGELLLSLEAFRISGSEATGVSVQNPVKRIFGFGWKSPPLFFFNFDILEF